MREYGDDFRALGWTHKEAVCVRHRVMADVVKWNRHRDSVTVLDFGCGLAHFLDCVQRERITYVGADIVPEFLRRCVIKHPDKKFVYADVVRGDPVPASDYTMINGVFTQKLDTPYDDMVDYFTLILKALFNAAEHGIAFNVMSAHVDWQRDDLFHVPFDQMAEIVSQHLSRNYVFRSDYGLREYTTYVYH